MAGRYGAEQNTVRNLKVVGVDAENNLLLVRGAIPGPNGGFVVVKQTNILLSSAAESCRAGSQRAFWREHARIRSKQRVQR